MQKFRTPFYLSILLVALAPAGFVRAQDPGVGLVNLYSFGNSRTDSEIPTNGLIRGSDGAFYGTTSIGGPDDLGTIFRVDQGGALTTLHAFTGNEGKYPGVLIQDKSGNLYGATTEGGANQLGTVFKLTPDGTFSLVHTFATGESHYDNSGLALGDNGNLYGTTLGAGDNDTGAVYRLSPQGALSVLHRFGPYTGAYINSDGVYPDASLIRGSDGNFYGTTARGGAYGYGTVFKMAPAGTLTTLHSFSGVAEGAFPRDALMQASDGNFYGTTFGNFFDPPSELSPGENVGGGSIFKMTPNGHLTVLYAAPSLYDGLGPNGPLLQAADGTIYGTTQFSGGGDGEIFRVTPDGSAIAFVIGFNYYQYTGDYPVGSLAQGSDGNLYGVTSEGGVNHDGGFFRLDFTPTYLGFAANTVATSEQAGAVSVHVRRTGDSREAVSIAAATRDGHFFEDTQNAYAGKDYTKTTAVLSWAAGETGDKVLTVPILDRGVYDDTASWFEAVLTDVSSGTLTTGATTCTIKIREAVVPIPAVTLAATTAQAVVGSGQRGEVTLSLPAAQTADVLVNYRVKGTAGNGTDYVALSGTAKIRAGQTTKVIKVIPQGDLGGAARKTVKFVLLPGDGYSVGTSDPVKVNLIATGG